ncbi:MAG: acyloxyacyl hydrolase [bacterium]|nr:acyloxyacyl hydrolase [bacterium]
MNRSRLRVLVLLAVLVMALAPGAEALADSLAVYEGIYDTESKEDHTTELGVEYRFGPLEVSKVRLIPAIGIAGTSDDNYWFYGGVRLDLELGRWAVTPQFAVSLYQEGGGKDLGGPVEFRSGLEVTYGFAKGPRVGLLFYHLSNGILYNFNPGSNSLVLTVSLGR